MVAMATTGGVTLGVTWIASGILGYVSKDWNAGMGGGGKLFDGYSTWPMWLPVVGPFVTIGTTAEKSVPWFFIVPAALGECTGLALLVAGLAASESALEPNDVARPTIYVTPHVGSDALGLGAVGTF